MMIMVRYKVTHQPSTSVHVSTGTMSAWYVWSVLGLYPLTGTDMYFIGSPVINSATLKLHKGVNSPAPYHTV